MKTIYLIAALFLFASCGAFSPFYDGHLIHVKNKPVKKTSTALQPSEEKEEVPQEVAHALSEKIDFVQADTLSVAVESLIDQKEEVKVEHTQRTSSISKAIQAEEDPEDEEKLRIAKKAERYARKAVIFGGLSYIPLVGWVFMILGWIFLFIAASYRYITPGGKKRMVAAIILLSINTALVIAITVLMLILFLL